MPKTKGALNGTLGLKIDKDQFEKLCVMQCTRDEIVAFLDVSKDTLLKWCKKEYGLTFEDTYKLKSEAGKVALRRIQFQHAQKNPTMAIWLGKQYLGQTDKVEQVIDDRVSIVADIPINEEEDEQV